MVVLHLSELIKERRRLSDNEIRRIAFDKVKRRLGVNPKNTFIENIRVVWQKRVPPFGVLVLVEVEGSKWRYWTNI